MFICVNFVYLKKLCIRSSVLSEKKERKYIRVFRLILFKFKTFYTYTYISVFDLYV